MNIYFTNNVEIEMSVINNKAQLAELSGFLFANYIRYFNMSFSSLLATFTATADMFFTSFYYDDWDEDVDDE